MQKRTSYMPGYSRYKERIVPNDINTSGSSMENSMDVTDSIIITDFSTILKKKKVKYSEQGIFYYIGERKNFGNHILCLSCISLDLCKVFELLLDSISEGAYHIRICKTDFLAMQLNGGTFSMPEVGKSLCIYFNTQEEVMKFVEEKQPKFSNYNAVICECAKRIIGIFYTCIESTIKIPGSIEHQPRKEYSHPPKFQNWPTKKDQYEIQARRRVLNWRYFRSKDPIVDTAKGRVYHGATLINGLPTTIILKESKPNSVMDFSRRGGGERLKFEYNVLQKIRHLSIAPIPYKYFERSGFGYLIMEEISGQTLEQLLKNTTQEKALSLTSEKSSYVFSILLKACNAISKLHDNSIIHRDINCKNIFISDKGDIRILDYEMCHIMSTDNNVIPFGSGTPGYAPPENGLLYQPNVYNDTYSIGAVISKVITGVEPNILFCNTSSKKKVLKRFSQDNMLIDMVDHCLGPLQNRPKLSEITGIINTYL